MHNPSVVWLSLAPAVSSLLTQNIGRIRIHQHSKPITNTARIYIHQRRPFAFNASAQHATQTQQRTASANFAGLTAAIADNFAVCTEHGFQQGNRIQDRIPFSTFVHNKKLAVFGSPGKYLLVDGSRKVTGQE